MKILFGILLAAALTAVALGLRLHEEGSPGGLLLGALGAAAIAGIAVFVPRYMHRREEDRKRAGILRARELADRLTMTGERFDVPGRSGIIAALGMTAIAVPLLGAWSMNLTAAVLGMLALLSALVLWMTVLPKIGRPFISVSREGLEAPMYGTIAWDAVEGLVLTTLHSKFGAHHALELSVPELGQLAPRMHPCARILYALSFGNSRQVARLRLRFARASPHFVHELAETLWERKTGRKNWWHPHDPELSMHLRRAREMTAALRNMPAEENPDVALSRFRELATMTDDLDRFMKGRQQRNKRLTVVLMVSAVLLVTAFIASKLIQVW
jgi:hypothetical protein